MRGRGRWSRGARRPGEGEGYIGGSVPAPMVAPSYDAARDAWCRAGRDGSPRLVALVYYALGDGEQGRKNVHDYYSAFGDFANLVASVVCDTPQNGRRGW